MKCPINETGFCSRHQIVHGDLALKFSQQEDNFGDRYRAALDKVFGVHDNTKERLPLKPRACKHLGKRIRLQDNSIKKKWCNTG